MILTMLLMTARFVRRRWAALAVAALLCGPWGAARAQGVDGGYLPSGGGTFIPFRGGPAGGLGMTPSAGRPPAQASGSSGLMGSMAGSGTLLGAPGGPTAPRPIGVRGMGRGTGVGGLLDRAPAMRSMPRAPVGSYPFRVPPSLRGGASRGPAMAM